MAFRDVLLPDNTFRSDEDGFIFVLGLPRYRSLPLSCVRVQRLTIDGQDVDQAHMRIRLNDKEFPLDRLADLHEEWWFVVDRAELRVSRPGGMPAGAHEVDLSLALRIPYVFVEGQSECPEEVTRCVKRLSSVWPGRQERIA